MNTSRFEFRGAAQQEQQHRDAQLEELLSHLEPGNIKQGEALTYILDPVDAEYTFPPLNFARFEEALHLLHAQQAITAEHAREVTQIALAAVEHYIYLKWKERETDPARVKALLAGYVSLGVEASGIANALANDSNPLASSSLPAADPDIR